MVGLSWAHALFILYINDIPDLILNNMRMFADDTKIYSVIRNFDNCLRLQKDLDQLSQSQTTKDLDQLSQWFVTSI